MDHEREVECEWCKSKRTRAKSETLTSKSERGWASQLKERGRDRASRERTKAETERERRE